MTEPRPETICVEAGARGESGDPVSPAVYLSTTYRQGGHYEYIRDGSPTIDAFERVVGELEGGFAVCFSSGMAAAAAVLDGLAAGSRVLAPQVAYLGVRKLLAEKAKAAGISKVTFDRAGYRYHGRVKALADGAREGGLEF